jgi:hypothetical protein
MRASLRQLYICLIPIFCVIGVPLVIYGGINIPSSLTSQEAWAAGTHQLQALEEKRRNSVEYKEMLIGFGFFVTSVAMLGICTITMWRCPNAIEESEPVSPDPTP